MKKVKLKIGDCISYGFLYSNEENKIGIITEIKKDLNFGYMITVVGNDSKKDVIPFNIMEFEIL